MDAINILIDKLPKQLKEHVMHCDTNQVMDYFFEEGFEDTHSAYLVSTIAAHMDTIESHTMADGVFHMALNWMETSYHISYFHCYRILELENFKNPASLKWFIEMTEEPDYDMISNEQIRFVNDKLKEIEPNAAIDLPDNLYEFKLPDLLDKDVVKAFKKNAYQFYDVPFGVTRREFEEKVGQPTETLINMREKYVTALYYRTRRGNALITPFFKGEKDMDESDYIYTDINYHYDATEYISRKKFIKVWGKPDEQGIAMNNESYRYGDNHVSIGKDWNDKFYVKQLWHGNKEAVKKEREKFIFEDK